MKYLKNAFFALMQGLRSSYSSMRLARRESMIIVQTSSSDGSMVLPWRNRG